MKNKRGVAQKLKLSKISSADMKALASDNLRGVSDDGLVLISSAFNASVTSASGVSHPVGIIAAYMKARDEEAEAIANGSADGDYLLSDVKVQIKNNKVEYIAYVCESDGYDSTELNGISCGGRGDEILNKFGSEVRVLCSVNKVDYAALAAKFGGVSTGGFNPDAYLASKTNKPRDLFAEAGIAMQEPPATTGRFVIEDDTPQEAAIAASLGGVAVNNQPTRLPPGFVLDPPPQKDHLRRVYDVVKYGIRYYLEKNLVVRMAIFTPATLESSIGINWGKCS